MVRENPWLAASYKSPTGLRAHNGDMSQPGNWTDFLVHRSKLYHWDKQARHGSSLFRVFPLTFICSSCPVSSLPDCCACWWTLGYILLVRNLLCVPYSPRLLSDGLETLPIGPSCTRYLCTRSHLLSRPLLCPSSQMRSLSKLSKPHCLDTMLFWIYW